MGVSCGAETEIVPRSKSVPTHGKQRKALAVLETNRLYIYICVCVCYTVLGLEHPTLIHLSQTLQTALGPSKP